jgi:type II secretory pathway pseudopilin PulG
MEIMVVIVIMAIVSIFTYTPYMLYKNKAWVNVAVKEIAQDLYLARSMAINWTSSWTGTTNKNLSIWLYLEAWEWKKIKFLWFSWATDFDISNFSHWKLLKTNTIENNIQINSIEAWWTSYSWALFFFNSITWKPEIYLKDSLGNFWTASTNTWFTINVSYKWTSAGILSKEINYNKSTFVIDY